MYLAQLVKNPPAMQETWVWSLGWEDLLEKGKASLLSTPAFWPGEVQGLYSPWGRKELDTTEWLWLHFASGEKKESSTSSFIFLHLRGGVSALPLESGLALTMSLWPIEWSSTSKATQKRPCGFCLVPLEHLPLETWVVVIGWFMLSHPKFICWSTHPQYLRTWPSFKIGSL